MALNSLSTAARNAAADAAGDKIDAGSSEAAGSFKGYTSAFAALLFKCVCSNPAFGAAVIGVKTANTIAQDSDAPVSGTAAVGRVCDRDGAVVFAYSIGTVAEDLNLNTISITIHDRVSILAATLTMPAA